MESQQIIMLRNNTKRKIENRGLNILLEEDAINEILSFASDFPGHEDDAVDLLLDILAMEHTSNLAPIIDIDLLRWTVNRLRAAQSTSSTQQIVYFESGNIEMGENHQDASDLDFWGSLFDPDGEAWIEQLSENDLSRYESFPFPASRSAIEALPNIFTTDDSSYSSSSWNCAVCMEDKIEANEGAKQMPCKHIFHTHCIIPWLELHNSCPLCRYQLPT